jgi:hypothetical protein
MSTRSVYLGAFTCLWLVVVVVFVALNKMFVACKQHYASGSLIVACDQDRKCTHVLSFPWSGYKSAPKIVNMYAFGTLQCGVYVLFECTCFMCEKIHVKV